MKKRIIAIMLSVMMVVTFIPTIAFANETGGSGVNPAAVAGEDISVEQSEVNDLLASTQALSELIEGLDPEGMSQDLNFLRDQFDGSDVNITSQGGAGSDEDAVVRSISSEELIAYLKDLSTKLDQEISLIDIYSDWFVDSTANLLPEDLYQALVEYKQLSAGLKDAVNEYIHASSDEERALFAARIKDALAPYMSAAGCLIQQIKVTATKMIDYIREKAEALISEADLNISIDELKIDWLAEELQASLESFTKLKEAYSVLKEALSRFDLLTPAIGSALDKADLVLDATGEAIKIFFDNAIAGISEYLKENLDSSVTSASLLNTLGLLKSYKAAIDKQIENILKDATGANAAASITCIISTLTKIIDFVKNIFCHKDAEKIAQLEEMNAYLTEQTVMLANAASITQVKPNLKSVKSSNRKVTGKWAAVSSGTVSHYQVYYKVTGKKAVKVNVTSYAATAKTISYTTKKLAKGKKCTFKVRGVYTMVSRSDPSNPDSAKITSTYYTNWSKAKTVKVK